MPPRFSVESLVVGVGLLALGSVGLSSSLGWVDFLTAVRTWWPAILVFWGLVELYNTYSARSARRTS